MENEKTSNLSISPGDLPPHLSFRAFQRGIEALILDIWDENNSLEGD